MRITQPAAEAAARPRRRRSRSSIVDAALKRLVNPVVRAVLRSPLHDLISDRVMLITFSGRLSGRWRHIPASYLDDDGTFTLLSRGRRRWWRDLRGGAPVQVLLRGTERRGWADAVPASRERAADILMRLYERAGHPIAPARAAELAGDRIVIRLRLSAARATPPPLRGRALWRRWIFAVTIGETIAFMAPAVSGAALAALDAPFWVLAPAVLASGASKVPSSASPRPGRFGRRCPPSQRSNGWGRRSPARSWRGRSACCRSQSSSGAYRPPWYRRKRPAGRDAAALDGRAAVARPAGPCRPRRLVDRGVRRCLGGGAGRIHGGDVAAVAGRAVAGGNRRRRRAGRRRDGGDGRRDERSVARAADAEGTVLSAHQAPCQQDRDEQQRVEQHGEPENHPHLLGRKRPDSAKVKNTATITPRSE